MATIRRSVASLAAAEKTALVEALLRLKNATPSQLGLTNRYDDYVQIHMESMMAAPGWAHQGPAFGPWHRAMLRNLEQDLQAIDPTIALPYWDWTVQNSPNPAAPGSPWTDGFLGGDGDSNQNDKVTSGPFASDSGNWPLSVLEPGADVFLQRSFGREQPTLPTAANVQSTLAETPYDAAPWRAGDQPSFRDRLEGWHGAGSIHNRVHLWVGGSMLPSTSPNDPVFFLHHANVDRLWAIWQAAHNDLPYAPGPNVAGAPQGHKLNDSMLPWGGAVTVASTLNHQAMGYSYDTDRARLEPFGEPALLPRWNYEMKMPPGHRMRMGVMFELSPEDKAAGGHAKEE